MTRLATVALPVILLATPGGESDSTSGEHWIAYKVDLTQGPVTVTMAGSNFCGDQPHCVIAGGGLTSNGLSSAAVIECYDSGLRADARILGFNATYWKSFSDIDPNRWRPGCGGVGFEVSGWVYEDTGWDWVMVMLLAGPGTPQLDIEITPPGAVISSSSGTTVKVVSPRDFYGGNAFVGAGPVGAGAGPLYLHEERVGLGMVGIFFPSIAARASVTSPNGEIPCDFSLVPVAPLYAGCLDAWVLNGPAGDWEFLVAGAARVTGPSDETWLLWADTPTL